ncbi:MAG: hypothetical protein HYW86_04595 [Candidatus Roizmanbacteria bacterium]|nr:MAG: hypothetical protein HYW86_04595 [Candidatus Roizmanbacteria bacterium]
MRFIVGAGVIIISFLIFSYKLPSSFVFNPDFARDLYDILKITQGKITLIGPKLTFGGIYSGPFYYYLFTPILYITNLNINALLYFNAFLFAAAIGYLFKKISAILSLRKSVLVSLVFVFLPFYLSASRNPSNAFSYLPFLMILLTYIFFTEIKTKKQLFFIGIGFGIIATFHLVNLLIVPFVTLFIFYLLKHKRIIVYFFIGLFAPFSYFILFEIKHNFIMLKNTFIDKSYLYWVNNKNIPGGLTGKKNIIDNIFFLSSQIKELILINPLLMILLGSAIVLIKKNMKKERILVICSLLSLLLLVLTLRYQFISHYLFSVTFFIFFVFIFVLIKSKLTLVLIPILLFEIIYFPKSYYQPTWRSVQTYEKAAQALIQNNIIKKEDSFNVIQITNPDLLSPNGFEYRFFLRKAGFIPNLEFEYKKSQVLYIFSEIPNFNINNLDSWEAKEFGKEKFIDNKIYSTDKITIYKISK